MKHSNFGKYYHFSIGPLFPDWGKNSKGLITGVLKIRQRKIVNDFRGSNRWRISDTSVVRLLGTKKSSGPIMFIVSTWLCQHRQVHLFWKATSKRYHKPWHEFYEFSDFRGKVYKKKYSGSYSKGKMLLRSYWESWELWLDNRRVHFYGFDPTKFENGHKIEQRLLKFCWPHP